MPFVTLEQAIAFTRARQAEGRTVVFTNGVFDLLHPGHVRYLAAARAEGDALVVAVNSDRSVRANKGPSRPIQPERDRAEILAALSSVDIVFVFDEETPQRIIDAVEPDVLVKGADWELDQIIGRDTVRSRGGRVVRAAVAEGHSTSRIIEKVQSVLKRDRDS